MTKPPDEQADAGHVSADQVADLADLILNVSHEIKMLSANGEGITLTLTESNVMRFVDRHPGTSPSALADGTGLHRSNMSAALRGLEEKGLISRAQHGGDGRAITVEPTELAALNLARLRQCWIAGIARALGSDSDGVQEAFGFLSRLETGLIRARQNTS